jgi:GH15 family glucan-1,4-alpha-glucosidase
MVPKETDEETPFQKVMASAPPTEAPDKPAKSKSRSKKAAAKATKADAPAGTVKAADSTNGEVASAEAASETAADGQGEPGTETAPVAHAGPPEIERDLRIELTPAVKDEHAPIGASPFPPIADYAFLSDCESVALVAPSGNVEWLCAHRPDGPAFFGAMLDRSAGGFRLGPSDVMVPAGRRYLPGTNVLETTWQTRSGWLIVRDALCIGPWHHNEDRSKTQRRTPTDHDAEHILLRTVKCVNGAVELSLDCEPVFNYGSDDARWSYTGRGYGECKAEHPNSPDCTLYLNTDLNVGFEGRRAHARTRMKEGDTAWVALSWAGHSMPTSYKEAFDKMERTAEFWRQWLNHGSFPDHPWRTYLQRSALVLKGLSYAPTGAIIAAATTSLPETPGGERNYDYRFTWIRDSTFTLWGLYTLGFDWEANDFFYFLADLAEEDELQIMYGVGGERDLHEQELRHLTGYDGARPVRIGNAAYSQAQHDVWGAVLDSVYLHTKSRDYLPERVWPVLKRQVEQAIANWRKPDRGIWEVRGEPKHFVSSKLMCWVALDRGARLARIRGEKADEARWSAIAEDIHAEICELGVDERGVFTQHYETDALDASALLMPLVRFLPADDPRIKNTVLAIADELTVDGLVLRYRTDQVDDGFAGEEGTFTICSFWLVSALCEIGQIDRARGLCEKLLGYASPLYLYAEEIDPKTGRHLGNFPQAFTHLALINAVMHVIRADADVAKTFFVPRPLVA